MKPFLKFDSVFQALKPSSTLHINETVNRLWQQGQRVFHMGFGESRFDVHPKFKVALANHADKKSYPAARGLPDLLTTVADYYKQKLAHDFCSEQVIIGPGSKALIYGLQMALDADVFLPSPSWVSYGPQATLLGKSFTYIPSNAERNYAFDLDEFDALVKASNNPCKLLIINSPNNPTGQVLSVDFLQELATYCRTNGIWVLSDEIYFEVCHGDKPHVSIATMYPEGTFVLGGLSKHCSIGGWRLGVGLLPNTEHGRRIMQKLTIIASEIWSGVPAPIQYAAIQAYSLHPDVEMYVQECRTIHGIRTQFFNQALRKMGVQCTRSEGGFYIMANFDQYANKLLQLGIHGSTELADYLLKHYAIATLPGNDFGIPEKTHSLRLSTSYLDIETEFDAERLLSLYRSGVGVKTFMSHQHHPNTHDALNAFGRFVDSIN